MSGVPVGYRPTLRGRLCRRIAARWLLHHGPNRRRGQLGKYLWNVGCYIDDKRAET